MIVDLGNYTKGLVSEFRGLVTSHMAQNFSRIGSSAVDHRTTRNGGYAKSIQLRRDINNLLD